MGNKVSIGSQIAAVEAAQKGNKLTAPQRRLLNQHLDAAAQTLRFVSAHEHEIREMFNRGRFK